MRDIRDPKELGEQLLHPGLRASSGRHHGRETTLSEVFTFAERRGILEVPRYSRTESTVQSTMEQYRQEMTELAAQGERAACVVCDEHGWAYVSTQDDSPDESVSEMMERFCYDHMVHRPHVWVRQEQGRWHSYTCPGKE